MFDFKAIDKNQTAEIVEKKSRFIANAYYVETLEQAEEIIQKTRKKYHDARHNCFAYCIETGDGGALIKYNDDGEPAKTAGAPILNVITSRGISNILIIVTRYFGGILLGSGGLTRAYSNATINVLDKCQIITKTLGVQARLSVKYSDADNLKYYCEKNGITIVDANYSDNIELIIETTNENIDNLKNKFENVLVNFDIILEKYIKINN